MKTPFLLALLLMLPLSAQQPATRRPGRGLDAGILKALLAKYDRDGDGKIARAEYPRGERGFANLDRDGNGVIDAGDTAAAPRRPARPRPAPGQRPTAPKLPKVGERAPDFELPMLGMKGKKVKLSSYRGKQPVALIFGSYT